MEPETFTTEELEHIRSMCEAAPRSGVNWAMAVSLFPTDTRQEQSWKERMLKGIELACPEALKR